MPHKQANLERQLATAQHHLDARNAELSEKGVEEKKRRKDPAWRQLNAQRLRLKSRIRSAITVTDLTEEVIRRKTKKPAKGEKDTSKKSGKKAKKGDKGAKAEKGDKKKKAKKDGGDKKKKN
jgi:hypothetical protein